MTDKKIITHPSIVHSKEIKEICMPLDQYFGIDYFAHVNVDSKGNFTALGKNPGFVEHYLSSKYYNSDVHLSDSDASVDYVIQDAFSHYGETNQLFVDCLEFSLHHFFTILIKREESVDAYHFATSKKNNMINEMYLQIFSHLKNFISYFTETVSSNKNLSAAYDVKFKIEQDKASYLSGLSSRHQFDSDIEAFAKAISAKRLHLLDSSRSYITPKERECLQWLRAGYTAEEIADVMNIVERTVRAHINNLKQKLDCKTLFQLGSKISQHNQLD